MKNKIIIEYDRCDGCGICVNHCPQIVFKQYEKRLIPRIADPERCFGCLSCEEDCHTNAIRVHRFPENIGIEDLPQPGAGIDFKKTYDLVVVGSGPAGIGAAIRGRLLGLNVLVIDRLPSAERTGHPDGGVLFPPTGFYTLKWSKSGLYLRELDMMFPRRLFREPFHDFLLVGPSGQKTASIGNHKTRLLVVDKNLFMKYLINRALELGTSIVFNTRVHDLEASDKNGISHVVIEGGSRIRGRVVISAEGISGRLTDKAGIPVNQFPVGLGYVPCVDMDPVDTPSNDFGYIQADGPQTKNGKSVPFASCFLSGADLLHLMYAPMQKRKTWQFDVPATQLLERYIESNSTCAKMVGNWPQGKINHVDGCRLFVRQTPKSFSRNGLIAIGDAIAPGGQITNLLAIKSGEIAAEVAAFGIKRDDVSSRVMSRFDRRLRKMSAFTSIEWLGNVLLKAPMDLNREELNLLYNTLRSFALGKTLNGSIKPLIAFYLLKLPQLLTNSVLRSYLLAKTRL